MIILNKYIKIKILKISKTKRSLYLSFYGKLNNKINFFSEFFSLSYNIFDLNFTLFFKIKYEHMS